jgi:hypothetical protein
MNGNEHDPPTRTSFLAGPEGSEESAAPRQLPQDPAPADLGFQKGEVAGSVAGRYTDR